MNRIYSVLFFLTISTGLVVSEVQAQDTGKLIENKNPFYEEIKKSGDEFFAADKDPNHVFRMDFSNYDLPKSKDDFKFFWHNTPISQGNTGTCWAFSTTSYFESEVFRLQNKKVKLSEIYTAYWEYVEKAVQFVDRRGDSHFAEGSEANAIKRIWEKYGTVPLSEYEGKLPGQKFHDHSKLFDEMDSYLKEVKRTNAWNKKEVLNTIQSILNYYLGVPPNNFKVDGKDYTPESYLTDYLKINFDDYIDIISMKQYPLYQSVEYTVEDNWWNDKNYHNVQLEEFISIIKKAVRNGYSIVIGGDVSESGIDGNEEVAMIPSYDIPAEYIDEEARQFRFSNGTTYDDHGIHIVGYKEDGVKDWFLIKDSGSRAFMGSNKGYMFYHEDYVKLKIIDFMVHKDMVEDIMKKFN